jgi:hypothetical protein
VKYEPYQPTKWEKRIDSALGLASPRAALQRMLNRERMNYFRYLAAQPTSARPNSTSTTAGEWLRIQREKMQVMWNAIDMVDNSGLCSGILTKFPTYVCGTLRWQARTGDKNINTAYQQYIQWKTNRSSNIDISGRFSLRQQCVLDIKSIMLKGDVGTNIIRDSDDELYLQGIEANRIGDPYRWTTSDTYVRGLTIDPRTGRIVSVRVYHQDRRSGTYRFDAEFPTRDKNGMPKFLFFTNPISFDDYRGVSLFKHAIDNSTYIDRMRQYELQALLWASSQSGVYYTKSGALPDALPFSRTPIVDRDGNQIDTYETRPNTITALSADGEKVEMFQHDRPSPNVIGMYENTIIDISVGAGLTKQFTWGMTGTGPEVRMASAQDARAIQMWQDMLREAKLDNVIMLLLGDGIAKKEIPYHPNWLTWDWFFPAKPTIDVGRESEANIEEMQACVNTGANVVAESGQGDVEDVIIQRGHEVGMMIDAAQDEAKKRGLDWEQVYALMVPPPRGRGQAGGMPAAAGIAADKVAAQNPDKAGATDDGVEIGGSNGKNGGGDKEGARFRANPDGTWTQLYRPDQDRDDHGRWTDEGGGNGGTATATKPQVKNVHGTSGTVTDSSTEGLSDTEKGWLDDHKATQAKFQKETGKLGLRYDAQLTGDRLPAGDLTGYIKSIGDYQHKNMLDHGGQEKYGGTQDYVSHEGKEFDVPDEPPQVELMTPKECYSNATKLMLRNPDKYDYAEGYYASSHIPFPLEHAWVVDRATGKVVDPTLGWQPKARYFGVQYPKTFVIKKLAQNHYFGVHSDGNTVNDVALGRDKDFKYGGSK